MMTLRVTLAFLLAFGSAPLRAQIQEVGKAEPAPVTWSNDDYTLSEGDSLELIVEPQSELNRDIDVAMDGTVSIPNVGSVHIAGQKLGEVRARIQRELSKYLVSPHVQLRVKKTGGRNVTISGYVAVPGIFPYTMNLHLSELIGRAGGFGYSADRKMVRVFRGEPGRRKLFLVDIDAVLSQGDVTKDFVLAPGDLIEVKRTETKVYVFGEVKAPGSIEYEPGMTLMNLVSRQGGPNEFAKLSQLRIFRADPKPRMIKVDFDKVLSGNPDKDFAMQAGDIVYVPRIKFATASSYAGLASPWVSFLTLILTAEILARQH